MEKQVEQEAEGFHTMHGARSEEEHFAELDRRVQTSISACGRLLMLGGVLVVGKNVINLCLTEGRLGVMKSIRDVIYYLILMAPLLLGDVDVETKCPEKSLSIWRMLVQVITIAAELFVCWHMLNS